LIRLPEPMRMTRATLLPLIAICAMLGRAHAEPASDSVLASVQVSNQAQCSALKISFNLRVQYISHFPVSEGQELRVLVRPIDAGQTTEILTRRESLRAPATRFGHIRTIDFEAANAAGPALVIQFDKPVRYAVSQGADFESLIVKVFAPGASSCKADFPSQAGVGQWSTSVVADGSDAAPGSARAASHGQGSANDEQKRKAAALMDEGRGAMRKGNLAEAKAKFKDVLKLPKTDSSAEAQELLGLIYAREKETAKARAEYEDYLVRYPSGEGADRVRQRLAGLITASGEKQPGFTSSKEPRRDDGRQTWTVSGSASQFYVRDDTFRTVRDPSTPFNPNEDLDAHQTHQNELISSLDAIATWSGNGMKSKLRFSGTEERRFDKEDDVISVASLFFDTSIRDLGTEVRVGRQTRNTGGVLGRFDGAVVSYQATDMIRLDAVGGSPVVMRRDAPFMDDKYFYGAAAGFGPFYGVDLTLFAIEQRDRSILDRRAVGTEMRYTDADKSAFGMFDYDIHFNELNAAALTGSWTLADKSNLHAGFDYRKSPYLSSWTALQGQTYPTLYQMVRTATLDEIQQLALDRTASFTSISGGFSHPFSEKLQASIDLTMTNFSGTPASGGVPAMEGTGDEYYVQTQIIANNILMPDDLFVAGFRYADLDKSNLYVVDLSARWGLMENLKINPRLLLSYQSGKVTDLEEFTIMPSVLLDYYFTRDWSLELEAGARWRDSTENSVEETSTELFFTIGYRYDFYADGMTTSSPSRAAPYGVAGPK
jgi:hypothetical protein